MAELYYNTVVVPLPVLLAILFTVPAGTLYLIYRLEKLMGDTSKLTDAVTKLGTDVDTLIAAQGTSDQSAIDAATSAVEAVDAKVVAATPTPKTT